MKWIFRPFFIAENEIACSTDSYFSNLSYIEERDLLVSLPWSWPFRAKNVRLSARGQNIQIRSPDVIRCVDMSIILQQREE